MGTLKKRAYRGQIKGKEGRRFITLGMNTERLGGRQKEMKAVGGRNETGVVHDLSPTAKESAGKRRGGAGIQRCNTRRTIGNAKKAGERIGLPKVF